MSIRLVTDNGNADYQAVADILDHFGLSHFDAATEDGHAIYNGNAESLKWMEDTGFLLEEGYRFGDNDYERQPYVSPRSIRQEQEKQNQTA